MSAEATSWAIRQRDLTCGAKLLLLVLANGAGKDGVTWIGRKRQAEDCCCRTATVSENVKRLEEAGLVRRVERRRGNGSRTSDYTVLAPQAEDRGEMVDADPTEYPPEVASLAMVRKPYPAADGSGTENGLGQVRISGGPDPLEEPLGENPPTPLLEDEDDRRARGFLEWYTGQLRDRRGRVVRPQGDWLRAAREIVVGRQGTEIRQVVLWGLDRGWWQRKINTLPKLAQHYPDLRMDWDGEQRRTSGRNGDGHASETEAPSRAWAECLLHDQRYYGDECPQCVTEREKVLA